MAAPGSVYEQLIEAKTGKPLHETLQDLVNEGKDPVAATLWFRQLTGRDAFSIETTKQMYRRAGIAWFVHHPQAPIPGEAEVQS